jgi:hypothetical protein
MRTSYAVADAVLMSHDPTATSRKPPFLTSGTFWRNFVLGAGIQLTALTGLVVGWLAVELQFFGASPDADDYEMAAGGYGAGALLLLLGALAVHLLGAPRWQMYVALGSAGLLIVLALSAVSEISSAEPGDGYASWVDGAGGVAACPWTWPLVVLAVWGVFRRQVSE